MRFHAATFTTDKKRTIVLRNAEIADAADLITYLKVTSAQTPYLLRGPEEIQLTVREEEAFIQSHIDAEREIMLVAIADEKLAGCCSLMRVGTVSRDFHRCAVAIALYQEFCGMGIGEMMMKTVLEIAKQQNYEQAELEVVTDNVAAIKLYEKLGFEKVGCIPHNMKYANGNYADADIMIKML